MNEIEYTFQNVGVIHTLFHRYKDILSEFNFSVEEITCLEKISTYHEEMQFQQTSIKIPKIFSVVVDKFLLACEKIQKEAENQYQQGDNAYKTGKYEQMIVPITRAAYLKHAAAQDLLGFWYMKGQWVEQDIEKAKKYFQLAAAQKYFPAEINLKKLQFHPVLYLTTIEKNGKKGMIPTIDSVGNSEAHYLAAQGKVEELKNLVEDERKWLNFCNYNYQTPLGIAIKNDCLEVVEYLLSEKAEISYADLLASQGKIRKLLLEKFKNSFIVENDPPKIVEYMQFLAIASAMKDTSLVNFLLALNVDIKQKDELGLTSVHIAAATNNLLVLKILLTEERDLISVHDNLNRTPLVFAILGNHLEIVKYLLDKDKDAYIKFRMFFMTHGEVRTILLKKSEDFPAFVRFADDRDRQFFEVVKHKAMMDENMPLCFIAHQLCFKNVDGNTAMHFAAIYNDIASLQMIFEKDKNFLNIKNNYMDTPFSLALLNSNLAAANFLLNQGAEISDHDLPTAIRRKVQENLRKQEWLGIIRKLVENGPKVTINDILDADKEVKLGLLEEIRKFLEKRFGEDKNTYLHALVLQRNIQKIKELFELRKVFLEELEGVFENLLAAQNKDGSTPLLLSLESGGEYAYSITSFLLDQKGIEKNLEAVCHFIDPAHHKKFGGHPALWRAGIYALNFKEEKLKAIYQGFSLKLISMGARMDAIDCSGGNATVAHLSVAIGDIGFLKKIFDMRPDLINIRDKWNNTLLITAFKKDKAEVIQYLLNQKGIEKTFVYVTHNPTDPNNGKNVMDYAIDYAKKQNDFTFVKVLIDKGMPVSEKNLKECPEIASIVVSRQEISRCSALNFNFNIPENEEKKGVKRGHEDDDDISRKKHKVEEVSSSAPMDVEKKAENTDRENRPSLN